MIDYAKQPDLWEWRPYFSVKEFTCKESGECFMDANYMQTLFNIRAELALPMIINSGYRSQAYNDKIGGEKNSAHMRGRAADVGIYGDSAFRLIRLALEHGITRIGFDQRLSRPTISRYVHLDNMLASEGYPSPWIWSYP